MGYSIAEVATLSNTSVRTLRLFEDVGLLEPSGQTDSGDARYNESDLRRLFLVLIHRELDRPLTEIAQSLDNSDAANSADVQHSDAERDADDVRRLRDDVANRVERLQEFVRLLDAELAAPADDPVTSFAVFGTWPPRALTTDREGAVNDERTPEANWQARFTVEEWNQAISEHDDLMDDVERAIADAIEPGTEYGMQLAEAHRQHLIRWYYDCPLDLHVSVTESYVADPETLPTRANDLTQQKAAAEFLYAAARAAATNSTS